MAADSQEPAGAPGAFDAIYEDGVLKPLAPLALEAGAHVRVQLVPNGAEASASHVLAEPGVPSLDVRPLDQPLGAGVLAAFTRQDVLLLAFGLAVYALTRFVGLTHFPIYFFSDEAVNPLLAEQLLRNGMRDTTGTWMPPYFRNDDRWTLSLSVYAQLLGVALFGKSVLETRLTSALISMLCPLAVTLTLKLVFKARTWWLGALVVSALPAWFLHARTGFETVLAVSFFACFLCAYLLYRCVSPGWLPLALVCGAATFYSYANGQGVMLAVGILLLVSDLRYHLRQGWRTLVTAALLVVLLAVPYIRFRLLHPEAVAYHLQTLDSYWLKPFPLSQKLLLFGQTYLQGINPLYWFPPNGTDLVRHQMKDMGHLSVLALPFVLIGLGVCVRRWRGPEYRAVLAALLAAPFSGSLVAILIPRVLFMIVPAALLIGLGFEQISLWLRAPRRQAWFAIGSGAALCVLCAVMLRAALADGPTWYPDYGLYGMQYGAEQVFGTIASELAANPDRQIVISPNWANNTTALMHFFVPEVLRPRLNLRDINYYLTKRRDLDPNAVYVWPPNEQRQALESGKFVIEPQQILPYPDGTPGFYFERMRYSDQADDIFTAEAAARLTLQEQTLELDGQQVLVRFSAVDIGQIGDLFDGRTQTLVRGREANPLIVELHFPAPRQISGFTLRTANMHLGLKVVATGADSTPPKVYTETYPELTDDTVTEFRFLDGMQAVSQLRIEFTELQPSEDVHIHLRELTLH